VLAEDLLLLLTDDASGKPLLDSTKLDLALAGAVLVELTEAGRIGVAEPGGTVRAGRVVVLDPTPTGDPLLDLPLQRIADRRPAKPQDLLSGIAKGLRRQLLARLAERGILRAEEGRILGIFPVRSWPAADSAQEDEVRRGLSEVLVNGRTPSPAEAALVSLLSAVDRIPKVLGGSGVDRRELKRRAKVVAQGEFAGAAVGKAVEAITAAVAAVVVVTTSSGN
jgi:Golgi phosphoprotein 3 (GPP34)